MMSNMLWRSALVIPALVVQIANAQEYHWPSPRYDALEDLLYTGGSAAVAGLAANCNHRSGTPESPVVSAEWLRLAYHDMATHNITDGTGGLDSSIYFELDRPENIGQGMIDSMIDFTTSSNRYVSRADVIAMGAIWGVAGCKGPAIPFRGGRIDATGAGRPGVPEPQQDLGSHTESFRLQGFTSTEMIQLVACGHTLGGVRNIDFPDIVLDTVPVDDTNPTGLIVKTFDTTDAYDTNVVTEYLDGTTLNPLIVVPNVTLRSDLRIFSSDGNTTMRNLADPTSFSDTCKTLIGRMLETVPSGVQLTEEIKLLTFKLNDARITVANAQIVLAATARVAITSSSKNVTLFWCQTNTPASLCSRANAHSANPLGAPLSGAKSPLMDLLNTQFEIYEFQTPVGPSTSTNASVAKFWFEVSEAGSASKVVEDNGGYGYVFDQDNVIAAPSLGKIMIINGKVVYNIVAGVRVGQQVTQGTLMVYDQVIVQPDVAGPLVFSIPFSLDATIPSLGGYTFYSANVSCGSSAMLDLEFDVDGKNATVPFINIGKFSLTAPFEFVS